MRAVFIALDNDAHEQRPPDVKTSPTGLQLFEDTSTMSRPLLLQLVRYRHGATSAKQETRIPLKSGVQDVRGQVFKRFLFAWRYAKTGLELSEGGGGQQ